MQDWLSTAISVLVILLIIGFSLRRFSGKSGNKHALKTTNSPASEPSGGSSDILSSNEPPAENKHIIPRSEHPISRKQISDNALKVLHRLNSHGYDAYLVGGCIRDLYLGLHPKDFDVTTNATPEQVRRLFRNSRLIGRRFKLVHILFGRETIEVATFRASHNADPKSNSRCHSHHSESGRILRDNVYGSMEEDAERRDFTINALYYDSRDFSVINHCCGVADIHQKQLRLIGDPVRRYHEDPVRMLRAIRFTAKLNFTMAQETSDPILDLGHLLQDIPSARLFDEILKLLQSGYGVKTFKLLREFHLLEYLFPATHSCLEEDSPHFLALIHEALISTDKRVKRNRPVTPAFLYAALLWTPMQRMTVELKSQGVPPIPASQQAAMSVLQQQAGHTAIPKRFTIAIREIWDLQGRLERRQPKAIESLLDHPKFRAAYDFLILREQSGEQLDNAGQWWTDIQETIDPDRHAMIQSLRHNNTGKKGSGNKRRRRRKPKNNKPQGESVA